MARWAPYTFLMTCSHQARPDENSPLQFCGFMDVDLASGRGSQSEMCMQEVLLNPKHMGCCAMNMFLQA